VVRKTAFAFRQAIKAISEFVGEHTYERFLEGKVLHNVGIEGHLVLIQDKITRWLDMAAIQRDEYMGDKELIDLAADVFCLLERLNIDLGVDQEPQAEITFDEELDSDTVGTDADNGKEDTRSEEPIEPQ
jgi:hypothetical protein